LFFVRFLFTLGGAYLYALNIILPGAGSVPAKRGAANENGKDFLSI
jgi:hypothetical protein